MRLLVCGDRHWSQPGLIRGYLEARLHLIEVVIEGEAPGADTIARVVAEDLGIAVLPFPADWTVYPDTPAWKVAYRHDGTPYNKVAGPERNEQMLVEGHPTHGAAFHEDLRRSTGTADMVRRLEKAAVPVDFMPFDTRPGREQLTLT